MRERKVVQARLYGLSTDIKHHCSCPAHQPPPPKTPRPKKTVKMELRPVEDPVSMYDESNSAHQFSVKNASVQADDEDRLEAQMQTSAIIYHSNGEQYENPLARSLSMQASEIEYRSGGMNTSLFGPNAPR